MVWVINMVRHCPLLSSLHSVDTAALDLAWVTGGESHLILPTHQKEKDSIAYIDIWSLDIPHFSLKPLNSHSLVAFKYMDSFISASEPMNPG